MEKNPQKTREKTSHSAVTREAYLGKFQKEIRSAVISRSHLFTISPAQVPINALIGKVGPHSIASRPSRAMNLSLSRSPVGDAWCGGVVSSRVERRRRTRASRKSAAFSVVGVCERCG